MKVVITHGTFDLLHYGHIKYLEKAKSLGEYLIVMVTSDEEARRYNKFPYYDEKIRMYMVQSIKFVDKVLLRDKSIDKDDIIDNKVDILVTTNDGLYKFDYLKEYCKVIYLDRTEGISTTKIKNDLKNRSR